LNVCVTGGAGFIGRHLVRALLGRGDHVTVLTRNPGSGPEHAKVFEGDLLGPVGRLADFIGNADVIYHCAGEVKDRASMHRVHVDGTRNLLDAAAAVALRSGKPIHWVQLSSVGAYGPPAGRARDERWVTEQSATSPAGDYETTKTLADELVRDCCRSNDGLTATILRPSNVFGPGMTNQSLFALMRMIKSGKFFYIGSRRSVATYIHVDDVVAALIAGATDARARGRVYNISNDCLLTEIVDALADAMKVARPRWCVPEAPLRAIVRLANGLVNIPLTDERISALVKRTHYSTELIRQELGWAPKRYVPEAMVELYGSLNSSAAGPNAAGS
jgi:nucleoside-diphosphate-sugar epimerase